MCYGYNTDGVCQKWEEIPTCMHWGDAFEHKEGFPILNMKSNLLNSSFGLADCMAIC